MKQRVLIVEDLEYFQDDLRRFLEQNEIIVSTAPNEQIARKLIESQPFDAVICDIDLSKGHGSEEGGFILAEFLHNSGIRIPFILTSSSLSLNDRHRAAELGVYRCVRRSFNYLDELADILRQLLRKDSKEFISSPTIVIITVNVHETNAALDAFLGKKVKPQLETRGGVTYNHLGVHGGCEVIHTISEMGAGSIGASQQRARDAIDHWKPAAIIATGIAFGLDESKQHIGDVLVSTHIQDYELGRLNETGRMISRAGRPSASDMLLSRLRATDALRSRNASNWPKVRFGLLLTGQKLLDNLPYRESLKKQFPEAIGGDMEAYGVYVSAEAAKVDWIIVKGICDWGHNKNNPEKETWQKLAAHNAAQVLKIALNLGDLYPDDRANLNNRKN